MSIFSLIAHASLLIHMGKDVQGIVQNLIQHKEEFPSNVEFGSLIDDAIALLSSGLINLPPDVLAKITDSIKGLKVAVQGA